MSVKHPCRNANSTSSLSSQIQQLFELPKKEFVYENFLCTYWQNFRIVGNLFVTENNLCFYGDVILGAKKKLVIAFDEIGEIQKGNGFGPTNNSIVITTKSGQEFRFTRFADQEKAFKLISDVKHGSPPLLEYDSKCDEDTQAGTPVSGSYVEVSTGSIVEEVPGKIIHLEANKKASPPETHKVSIPISTDSFFEKLFADEAVFPYSKAMELSDAMDVQLSKWKASDNDSYQYMREMSMVVKVTGVPFRSKTRVQSTQYYIKNDDELKVHIIKKNLDIPYADSFHVEEYWTVKPEYGQQNQSILTITGEAVFSKSVTVEKIIKSRTQDALQKEHELWLKNTKDKDIFSSPKVTQTATLSFGSLEQLDEAAKVETTTLKRVESAAQRKTVDLNKRCFYVRMTIATMAFVILILLSVLMVMYGRLEMLESRVALLENSKQSSGNYYSLNQHYRK